MSINPRIVSAIGIGAALIAFAYFSAPDKETPTTQTNPYSIEEKRTFIPVGDSDNDGVPDWSESFRQAEVPEIDRGELDVVGEVYTPPDTLTGQLAVDLFSNMIEGEVRGPLGPSQEDILNRADRKFKDAATDELYELSDLNISQDNSVEALYAYSNQVAEIMLLEPLPEGTRSEIEVIQHAVYSSDPEVLNELDPTIQSYANIRENMLALPAPSLIAQEHLNLINTFHAIHNDITGMKQAFTDPMYTVVRMQRYYDDILGLNNATIALYTKLGKSGIEWEEDDIAYLLIGLTIQ